MNIKSNREEILLSLILEFENNINDKDKIKDIYYKTIIYSGKIFGWVEKQYYKTWLSKYDWNRYMFLKQNGSKEEFDKFKLELIKYFNGTIQSRIHQKPWCFKTVHHINEVEKNIPSNLSSWEFNTEEYWEHHFPDNLVYIDYMFHYFIHIMIMVLKDENGTNLYNEVNKIDTTVDKGKNLYLYLKGNYTKDTWNKLNHLYSELGGNQNIYGKNSFFMKKR